MTPSSAKHTDHADGTATVEYNDGVTITYASKREASIESLLRLFPGTSREFLEKCHRGSR